MRLFLPLLVFGSADAAFQARAARERARVAQIARLPANVSGHQLLEYVLRDEPVVLAAAANASTLARLADAAFWEPGAAPDWFRRTMRDIAPARDGVTFVNESTRRAGDRWGCRGSAKQCQMSWWYAGASPRGRAGRGANVHTDAVCLPAWTLQVSGPKSWTFARRGPAERGVPLGDEFYGAEVWAAELEPGDLLIFYNGWQPHATEADGAAAAVNGVLEFPELRARLWGPAGVAAKGAASLPSPRLLAFCPDVRDAGGFASCSAAGVPDAVAGASVAVPPLDPRSPVAHIDVGYFSSPALGDLDGDGDVDLAVGDAMGRIHIYENVGDASRARFEFRRTFRGADGLASPAIGDIDDDGTPELAVGGADGRISFFAQGGEVWAPPIALPAARAAPALVDLDGNGVLDLLAGAEDSVLRAVLGSHGSLFEGGKFVVADPWAGRCAVAKPAPFSGGVAVGDGRAFQLRWGKVDAAGALRTVDAPGRLGDVDIDAITEVFEMDVGGYPAPALADLNGDGVEDLVLGEHYGTLLFFDGADPVLRRRALWDARFLDGADPVLPDEE